MNKRELEFEPTSGVLDVWLKSILIAVGRSGRDELRVCYHRKAHQSVKAFKFAVRRMLKMKAWLILLCILYAGKSSEADPVPVPAAWPEQFHSLLYINNSGSLQVTDLWYDWSNGRNFNIIQKQLGRKLYDLEWNNGTSFYYYLDKNECKKMHFEVGILRPNWLEGAHYVGVQSVNGFLCNVWEKADFIHYYEDIATKRPVHWLFYTGMSVHVITFEVGSNLEDVYWQAPSYCFEEDAKSKRNHIKKESHLGRILAGFKHISLFQ